MRGFLLKKSVLAAILLCGLLPGAWAQRRVVASSPNLTVYARTQEKTEDRIIAFEDVEVHYKDIIVFADRAQVDVKTKDVFAEGHVSIQLPSEVIDCERILFNLDTGLGKFENALGRIQPSVLYEAGSVERKADNLYSLVKAQFTSCTQPVPRWKFSFSRANIKKDDYVEMWGALFSIKRIPIFYLPYMRYPLGQERSTGFLTPQIGYSQVKGFSFSEDFFWVISRNMDATFNLDYYAAKGIGAGVEYRYLFSQGTGGALNLYYFLFKNQPGQARPENAYIVRWNHNQLLPGGFSFVANVDYQNSFEFLREFDNNFRRALTFNRSSQVYISRSWSPFNLNIRASRFETSFPLASGAAADSIVTTYLPEVNFDSFKMKIFSPLYFSFSSSFTSWQYGWETQYRTHSQLHNQEFTLNPVLSLPFTSIPWLTMNFSAEGLMKYSWRSRNPGGEIVDQGVLARNYAFNIELIGPVFFRIWDLKSAGDGQSRPRLKHVIEPAIIYRYESPFFNGARVLSPFSLFRYHQIVYGLTNHILLKRGETPREILTWGLTQAYYLAPEESPMSYFRFKGEIPRFSEIQNYLRFYPGSFASFDCMATFNTYTKDFSNLRLGASLRSPNDNVFINVSWFKSTNPWYPSDLFNRHQISFYGGAKIPALSLDVMAETDFNIVERKMLFTAVNAVYHYQCLDLKANLSIYFFREKPEIQYKISFGLGNIGKTTDFLGGANFN
jgi:LPS-assembly protein